MADDKMSILAVRFKINASVDAHDPRPVLPLAHGDPRCSRPSALPPRPRTPWLPQSGPASTTTTPPAWASPTPAGTYARFGYSRICLSCHVRLGGAPLRIEGRRWCVQDLPAAAWHRPQARLPRHQGLSLQGICVLRFGIRWPAVGHRLVSIRIVLMCAVNSFL
ncbi:hypothetical protein SORBI_3005G114600 [Sorghum bicolor]|uniref:Uncharacterized protein n=1 Tax=Sorghum bicolor TaxID=4558 RepID=A0A1B6PRT4_SORBI|nr:hypothetical protein SORBI_3005G114600 [Sorghum bicolor]